MNIFLIYIVLFGYVYSFKNKLLPLNNEYLNNKHLMKPNDMINYLTSFKDYTIITTDDNCKSIEDLMIKNDMKVYYVNLNNLLDKNEILDILINKYNNFDSSENLWIFYRGFFIGSRYDIYKIIKK
jgi:hypothetical protein